MQVSDKTDPSSEKYFTPLSHREEKRERISAYIAISLSCFGSSFFLQTFHKIDKP
jgi:hypothetical protein